VKIQEHLKIWVEYVPQKKIKKTIPFPVAPKENKIPTSKFNQGCEKPVL